jgi:hypothetical protein
MLRLRDNWLLRSLRRRRTEPAFDVIGLLQPRVEIARGGFRQLDARRLILAVQSGALDVAVEALLGVVTAAVDGALIAPALLENFLDSLDERRALLRVEHTGGDPLRSFELGFVGLRLAARNFFGGDVRGSDTRLLGTLGLSVLVSLLLGGGLGEALGFGLLACALLGGFLFGGGGLGEALGLTGAALLLG